MERLEELVVQVRPRLLNYFEAKYSGRLSRADIEDAFQDALVRAWEKFGSYDAERKLSGWVFGITVRTVRATFGLKVRERISHAVRVEELAGPGAGDDEGATAREADRDKLLEAVKAFMLRQPWLDREILRTYAHEKNFDADGATAWTAALSKETGLSPGALRTRLHRLANKLKQYLADRGFYLHA